MEFVLVSSSFSFLLAVACVWMVREVALRYQLHDAEIGGRKLHKRPVPRLGGIGLVLAFTGTLIVVLLTGRRMATALVEGTEILTALAWGGSIIVLVGLLDDFKGVRSWTKLAAQIAAALAAFYAGVAIDAFSIPYLGVVHLGWLSLPVTVFWVVAVINGLNLIDGMDGLAGSVVALAGSTICMMMLVDGSYVDALVLGALVGATCGFLVYNANPASIFMGDTGSLFSGFVLAIVVVDGSQKSTAVFSMLGAMLALGLPLADLTISVVRRGLSGGGLFTADQHHIHHRLLLRGLDQRQAMIVLFGGVLSLEALALLFVYSDGPVSAVLLAATIPVMIGGYQLLGYPQLVRSNRRRAMMESLEEHAESRQAELEALQATLESCTSCEECFAAVAAVAPTLGLTSLIWQRPSHAEPLQWAVSRTAEERDLHLQSLHPTRLPLGTGECSFGELVLVRNAEEQVFAPFEELQARYLAQLLTLSALRLGLPQEQASLPPLSARPR